MKSIRRNQARRRRAYVLLGAVLSLGLITPPGASLAAIPAPAGDALLHGTTFDVRGPERDSSAAADSGKVRVTVHDAQARQPRGLDPAVARRPTAICDAVVAGPGTSRTPIPVALSAAHNLVREFAVDSAFYSADEALTNAVRRDDSLSRAGIGATLRRYASALSDTCAMPASDRRLSRARVLTVGDVAMVRPGTGTFTVPQNIRAGVIDLRDLPATADVGAAVLRAVAPFLASPVEGPDEFVRVNDGPKDEVYAPESNVYTTSVGMLSTASIPATGSVDRPLLLLTGSRLPPAVARIAGILRTNRRAWLAGASLHSAVAELAWRGVGRYGIAVRTSALDRLAPARVSTDDTTIHQDDPNDPTTAGYRRDFTLSADVQQAEITTRAAAGNDIDVYLLKDLNGDGRFEFPDELVAYSAGPTPDEDATLSGESLGGNYELLVHGFSVPSGAVSARVTTSVRTGGLWPDVIRADLPLGRGVPQVPAGVPPALTGPALRSVPATEDPGQSEPIRTGRPELRAALIIAHGMVRRYWKYFDVQGDRIDGRLRETLAQVNRWNGHGRTTAFHLLQRFGQALRDGHQFVVDNGPPSYTGYLPVFLDSVDGLPVVRSSATPAIRPGDTIETIDGRSTRTIYRDEYRLISTATTGYRFDVASRYVSRMTGPETLVLADPTGRRRTVRVDPAPRAVWLTLQDTGVTARTSESLNDLGAPDLGYVNLNNATLDQIDSAISAANAAHAKALVVDMRGYPGAFYGDIAERFVNHPFLSTPFSWNHFDGPDRLSVPLEQDPFEPTGPPHWSGPIVLLTGPHAVSAAESTMQMLVAYDHPVAVIGQQSAGTTGNLSGVQLPGGFGFTYTGLLVRNVGGSRFMGVGIRPDIAVPVTAADLAVCHDRDLLTAISVLHSRGL